MVEPGLLFRLLQCRCWACRVQGLGVLTLNPIDLTLKTPKELGVSVCDKGGVYTLGCGMQHSDGKRALEIEGLIQGLRGWV